MAMANQTGIHLISQDICHPIVLELNFNIINFSYEELKLAVDAVPDSFVLPGARVSLR